MKHLLPVILLCWLGGGVLVGCSSPKNEPTEEPAEPLTDTIADPQPAVPQHSDEDLRKIIFSLVSSAENSSLNYAAQYSYIEDIGDGRGYTAGIIGFCSGTGDMLDVVLRYQELLPDNILVPYIPALQKVVHSDSHDGLGDAFIADWKKAAKTPEMIQAQNDILDEQYMSPAKRDRKTDGLSPLGLYIYYDAYVMHGPGSDSDSFGGIRKAARKAASTPAQGGDEATYLRAFLSARKTVMLKEEAHSDLSRLKTQEKFISEGKFNLELPLSWTMYGDRFTLKTVPNYD